MNILDNAKEIAEIIKKYDDLPLYQRIIDLRDEIFNLREENLLLKERIKELERVLETKQKMTFRKPFYYQENDPQPYCAKCWEADNIAIHLDGPSPIIAGPRYDCPNCKTMFIHPRRDPSSYPPAETDFSPF